MLPCDYCGAENYAPCFEGCLCQKCVFPEAYEIWKLENPDAYERYLDRVLNDEEWYWYNVRVYGIE